MRACVRACTRKILKEREGASRRMKEWRKGGEEARDRRREEEKGGRLSVGVYVRRGQHIKATTTVEIHAGNTHYV